MTFNQLLKQGLLISFAARYSSILVQLIVGMILARLLSPAEFGIFAIIMVFIAFFNLMSNIGIGPAVIQSKEVNKTDIAIYFYLSIALGIILSGLFVGLTFVLVKFYSNEVYLKLGFILTISIFFTSISILPLTILSKKKKFKEIGILKFSSAFISGIFAVLLAYKNYSYYSLVAQAIIEAIILFLGSFFLSRFCFFLKKDKIAYADIKFSIKKIAKYSSYNFAFNFINYFSRNLDNILIGKFLGSSSLGFYDKAYRLMLFPISSLNQVFSPIIHPLLAEYQEDKEFIFQTFSKMIRFLALIGIPSTLFLYYNANDIILSMYGKQWLNSIPIFKILSLTVWIQILVSSLGAIFLAANKANLYFYNGLINAIILITAIILGIVQANLIQLSYYLMIAYYLSSLFTFYIMMVHVFNKNIILLIHIFIKPSIVGLFVLVFIQINFLFAFENIFIRLLINSTLSIVGFIIGTYITREYQFLYRIITKK